MPTTYMKKLHKKMKDRITNVRSGEYEVLKEEKSKRKIGN